MIVFADTSAIVKFYVDEVGHEEVRAIKSLILISEIARVEVAAALWKKVRINEVAPADAQLLISTFEFDLFGGDDSEPRFHPVAVNSEVVTTAARLTGIHGLRAYDALQLASALVSRNVVADCTGFAAFDKDLKRAAAAEGFFNV